MTSEGLAIHSWKNKSKFVWILFFSNDEFARLTMVYGKLLMCMSCWVWCVHQFWHAWNWWTCVLVWIFMVLNWLQRTYPKNGWDGPCFCRSPNVRVKPPHAQWLRQQKLKGQSPLLRESMQSCRTPWPRTRSCPILCRQLLHHLLPGLLLTGPVCWLWLWSASTCNKCCFDSIIFLDAGGDIFISSHSIQGSRLPRWGRKNKLPKVWLRPTLQVLWATWSISCQNIHGLRLF